MNIQLIDNEQLYDGFYKKPVKVIDNFHDGYEFLSNFSKHGFHDHYGTFWPTNEHYFQAMKSDDSPAARKMVNTILSTPSPGKAKRLGQLINMRTDWDIIRIFIMSQGLRMKFDSNPDIKIQLMNTVDYNLIEGNTWKDLFWGIDIETGRGQNHLGRLLMILRTEYISNHLKQIGLLRCSK